MKIKEKAYDLVFSRLRLTGPPFSPRVRGERRPRLHNAAKADTPMIARAEKKQKKEDKQGISGKN